MKFKNCSIIVAVLSFATTATAQEATPSMEAKMADVNARYAEEWAGVQRESQAIKDDAPEGMETALQIDATCNSKRHEIKLDIPEMSMSRKDMSLDLPQVSMESHRVVWDNPETYMATTTCGYYPEFHGWKMRMRPIKCDLPQVRMVRREASTDLPKVKWDRTEIKMDIPEFRMQTQRWSFDLPDCKITEVSAKKERMEEASSRLQERAADLAGRQKSEIHALVAEDLMYRRRDVDSSFAKALSDIQDAIDRVKRFGIDPSNVYQEGGDPLDLLAQLVDIQNRRNAELAKIDQSIAILGGLTGNPSEEGAEQSCIQSGNATCRVPNMATPKPRQG